MPSGLIDLQIDLPIDNRDNGRHEVPDTVYWKIDERLCKLMGTRVQLSIRTFGHRDGNSHTKRWLPVTQVPPNIYIVAPRDLRRDDAVDKRRSSGSPCVALKPISNIVNECRARALRAARLDLARRLMLLRRPPSSCGVTIYMCVVRH